MTAEALTSPEAALRLAAVNAEHAAAHPRTALDAGLAARTAGFPPVVVFGGDARALGRVAFNPDFRVFAAPEDEARRLTEALRFWSVSDAPPAE